jgi:uncharacterized protein involved in exopolysaccharide biosynthesis
MRPYPEPSDRLFEGNWWPRVRDALARQRRFLAWNWVGIVVLAAIVSLLLPQWYRARATLLPPQTESDLSLSFSALLRGGDLTAGRLPRTTSPEDVFTAILTSRTLGRAAVERYGLAGEYHARRTGEAIDLFQKHLDVGTTREGMVYVAVEDRSPERAAAVANFMVAQLDSFNKDVRMTSGKSARLFVERRLAETQRDLRDAEDRLKAYQVQHGVPVAGAQDAISANADAMAQQIALNVKLQTLLQTQSESSEEVRRVRGELAALEGQLKRMPQAGTEVARLMRDVRIQDQVYVLLTAQYEEAKVREHKDTPTVQVLDPAERPDRKIRPRRGLIVGTAALLALVEGCLVALVLDRRRGAPGPRVTPL